MIQNLHRSRHNSMIFLTISTLIREAMVGTETFQPKHVLIATWKNVSFAGGIPTARHFYQYLYLHLHDFTLTLAFTFVFISTFLLRFLFFSTSTSRRVTNTFQAVIVTDEVRSYAIFNYDWLGWTTHTEAGGDTSEGQVWYPISIHFQNPLPYLYPLSILLENPIIQCNVFYI